MPAVPPPPPDRFRPPAARLVAVALALAALHACAIVGTPDGGLRDVAGPVLDTALSSPNFAVDYRPDVIEMTFDEYVVLKDAAQNIVFSPRPPTGRPQYVQRGRTVRVEFEDVELADATTYQVQFGNAIQDFNEGNPAERLRYVFSTGSYLDSLQLDGEVVDNVTGAPVIGAVVGLYRSPDDTALVRTPPDYFARADSSGRFRLDYLAPGTYQLAAYLDDNGNLRLNQGAEPVGFLDSLVTVAAATHGPRPALSDGTAPPADSLRVDSTAAPQPSPLTPQPSYTLTLSAERAELAAVRGDQAFPGLIRVTLNQPVPRGTELAGVPGEVLAAYRIADTLFAAYRPAVDTLPEAVVALEGEVDTVRLRRAAAARAPRLAVDRQTRVVPGRADVEFAFNLPLAAVDAARVRVVADSLEVPAGRFRRVAADPLALRWLAPTDTVAGFEVQFLPGALTTAFDSTNADTIAVEVRPKRASEFGTVDLEFAGLDSARQYVLEVLGAGEAVERTVVLAPGQTAVQLARVAGGDYSVRLVDDVDGDGFYSPGDRRLNRQPERVRNFVLQTVRADWVVEERIDILAPVGPLLVE